MVRDNRGGYGKRVKGHSKDEQSFSVCNSIEELAFNHCGKKATDLASQNFVNRTAGNFKGAHQWLEV